MKKILTLFLTLCLVVGLAPMALADSDPAPYISVLQDRAAQYPDPNFGEAMLCDLDGQGGDELVLFYLDSNQATVEVCTISGGKPVQALAPTAVYAQAGGNNGYVAKATKDGQPYLLTFSASPEITDETIVTTGAAKLYAMHGQNLVVDTVISYTETIYIGPEGSNIEPYLLDNASFCVINGDRKNYTAMEDEIDALQLPMWNLGFTSEDYDDDAAPMKTFLNEVSTGFDDVPATAYYARPVMWAVEKGVTTGTSATKFSPNATLTRAQTVTFLWRLEGEPGGSARFHDVPAGAYYADAVAWAAENGITTGTSATSFSPNQTCTRAQTVTFLYRDIMG